MAKKKKTKSVTTKPVAKPKPAPKPVAKPVAGITHSETARSESGTRPESYLYEVRKPQIDEREKRILAAYRSGMDFKTLFQRFGSTPDRLLTLLFDDERNDGRLVQRLRDAYATIREKCPSARTPS